MKRCRFIASSLQCGAISETSTFSLLNRDAQLGYLSVLITWNKEVEDSMIQFFVKRLIGLVFVIIGVTFITFIMGYFGPTDPIVGLLGQHFTRTEYLQLKHVYGLDLPWYQQYYNYLANLIQFKFGFSYQFKSREVWDILKDGVPVSLELGF